MVAADANRPAGAVHNDDGMEAIGLAGAAIIFDRLACPERTIHNRYSPATVACSATRNFPSSPGKNPRALKPFSGRRAFGADITQTPIGTRFAKQIVAHRRAIRATGGEEGLWPLSN
jgi:hypothetical protein